MPAQSALWSILYGAGMVAVFIGERLVGAGGGRTTTTGAGVLLVLLALAMRAKRMASAKGDVKRVEKVLLGLYGLGALSLLFYMLQSDLGTSLFGQPLERSSPKLAGALSALYPALWFASIVPMILVEMAYAAVARAPKLEVARIHDAMLSGLGLAGALVFAFTFTYVATERDKKLDLSYFRTARPGESSKKIVGTLDKPVEVALFFPPANEVREEVKSYFDDLRQGSPMLKIDQYDHAVDPGKAKELGVSGNGIVVIKRETRKELLSIGLELESARGQLRNLDKEVQKRLLLVAKPQRTVYLTTGHGERASFPANDTDKRATIRDLRELLTQQGYTLKDLGAAEGLAADVPQDAAVVMSIGPQKPFFPEEVAALDRYLERGGRLFLALDPEAGVDHKELVALLGLKFEPKLLANDQIYARRTAQASDRANIATGSYSSHPAVTTLGRLGMRAPMVLFGAGWLEELKGQDKPSGVSVDFPVRAHPATFNDLNGNFQFDGPQETRKGWELAAAVTKKKAEAKPEQAARALLVTDSDGLSDGVLGNPGNAYFVYDGVKWLLGDEAITGEVSSEVDVPIAHTNKQDVIWFYSTIFLAPALTLGIGRLVLRRRGGGKKKEKAS